MTSLQRLTPLPLEEVKELVTSEEGTCLKRKEGRLTLQVPPKYGAEIRKGVRQELDALASRYSRQLGGIPMAWEKVHTSSTGALIHTSPFIHVSVQGTFYIFSPEVDAVLQGTVKKKSPSHLSCLVHKIFNVSVPRPQEVSAQEWEGSTVEEGDVIKVVVTNVDMSLYLPIITGRLESVVARKPRAPKVDVSESATRKVFTDSGISGSEEEEEEDEDEEEDEQKMEEKEEEVKAIAKKKNEKKKVKMKSSGDKQATKKVTKVAKKVKSATKTVKKAKGEPIVSNGAGKSPAGVKEKANKKKKKTDLTLREAESDALFLSSLIAEDTAGGVVSASSSSSPPRVSKKRKAEDSSPLDSASKKKGKKRRRGVDL